jgi:hypothetical protein
LSATGADHGGALWDRHRQQIEEATMRVLRAAAMIALLAGPAGTAYAQTEAPIPRYGDQTGKTPEQIGVEKRADKAYQKSLGNIPEQAPADPWGSARGTDAPKAAAKSAQGTAKLKPQTKTGSTAN